ncbi:hypothetical protein M9H77_16483 [Catharanthus roseus]|uniref:Uncharacterized protein n=1 Tax=Catharanthus roseus TaxID=4058 RepID=A0ACC0B1W3_CATRO|nr:hypothetical protein M9H77_16483 [Catharanthus roseus]
MECIIILSGRHTGTQNSGATPRYCSSAAAWLLLAIAFAGSVFFAASGRRFREEDLACNRPKVFFFFFFSLSSFLFYGSVIVNRKVVIVNMAFGSSDQYISGIRAGKDFNFPVIWSAAAVGALGFSIPDLRSPWIWLREVFYYCLWLFPLITLVCHLIMSVPKIETDKFDGKSNFVMWRRKMKAVLVQNKIAPAICSLENYPESWKGEVLGEKLSDAHSCLTLH